MPTPPPSPRLWRVRLLMQCDWSCTCRPTTLKHSHQPEAGTLATDTKDLCAPNNIVNCRRCVSQMRRNCVNCEMLFGVATYARQCSDICGYVWVIFAPRWKELVCGQRHKIAFTYHVNVAGKFGSHLNIRQYLILARLCIQCVEFDTNQLPSPIISEPNTNTIPAHSLSYLLNGSCATLAKLFVLPLLIIFSVILCTQTYLQRYAIRYEVQSWVDVFLSTVSRQHNIDSHEVRTHNATQSQCMFSPVFRLRILCTGKEDQCKSTGFSHQHPICYYKYHTF